MTGNGKKQAGRRLIFAPIAQNMKWHIPCSKAIRQRGGDWNRNGRQGRLQEATTTRGKEGSLMKILVAMDDSRFAQKALDTALRLARTEPSEIVCLSVVPQLGAIDEMSPRITEKLKAEADRLLKAAADKAAKADIKVKTVVEQGVSPADNIIGFAGEHGTDLIVVGHRGRANLEKFLLGSVALRTVSHAPCSVIVVK
jgi:nucleotide-binding universal stress UspA family protein